MSTLIFKLPHALPSSATTLQVVALDDAAVPVRTLDAPLSVLPELAGAEGFERASAGDVARARRCGRRA